MPSFKKLQHQQFAKNTTTETAEEKYWNKFKIVKPSLKLTGPVTNVCFDTEFDYAVSCGARVVIYNASNGSVKRSLARFKDIALGGSFRHDGKLFAAGCENHFVYVFNSSNGSLMRVFKSHKGPVHSIQWETNGSFLFSCSDDKTVRYLDVGTESEISVMHGHTDLVRTSCKCDDLWVSGSYDHTIRLWDVRTTTSAHVVNVAGPIESVDALSQSRVAIANGNSISVWDLVAGKIVKEVQSHQKTITKIFQDGTGTRLLSASLDGIIKVHDAQTLSHTASVVVGSGQGILSAGISKNNGTLVVGCVGGDVVVQKRPLGKTEKMEQAAETTALYGGTYKYFMRGGNVGPSPGDFKPALSSSKRLAQYDKHLKKFNYKQALDEVLLTRAPSLVVALLDELISRNGLHAALASRDDQSLENICSFLLKFLTHPKFSDVLVKVCEKLLDIYQIGHSVLIDEVFTKLQTNVRNEVALQKNLIKLAGSMDILCSHFN